MNKSLSRKNIKSEITDLYVSNKLEDLFNNLLEDSHLTQGPSGDKINSFDYFDKNLILKFFENDNGEIKNKPVDDFYVSFQNDRLKDSTQYQKEYMKKVILGDVQYYKILKEISPSQIDKLRKGLGGLSGNIEVIRTINKFFPALNLGLLDSEGNVLKEGGAAKKYFVELFAYSKIIDRVNNDVISRDLIEVWEQLVLSEIDVSEIKVLFKEYVKVMYPSLMDELFSQKFYLFGKFANSKGKSVAQLLNILKSVSTRSSLISPLSIASRSGKLSDIINRYYSKIKIFSGLAPFENGKHKMTLPQFSALFHFDYDTFKTFLLFSVTEEQALKYYNAWQKALAESDNEQLPGININAPGYTSTWVDREQFESVLYDMDKGLPPLNLKGKILYGYLKRGGVISRIRYGGIDEIGDSRLWQVKNEEDIYESHPRITTFADEVFRKKYGRNVDIYSKVTEEYRNEKGWPITRVSKGVFVDHGTIFARETYHGSGIYVDQKEIWFGETLDQNRKTFEFNDYYIYQKGEDGYAAILAGDPYYGICKSYTARIEIELRILFESTKMKYLGTHIPIPTHNELWLIAEAKKMDVVININGVDIHTTTLGIRDIMLNLDKILIKNPELLLQTKMTVERMTTIAHEIQERFGIKFGVGNAPGIITPIEHIVWIDGNYYGRYTIDTHAFWWANDNIGNRYSHNSAMYYNPFDRQYYLAQDVPNYGFYMLQILLDWQNHPKLIELGDPWSTTFTITP